MCDNNTWKQEITSAVRDVGELLQCLDLHSKDFSSGVILDPTYPVLVPRSYLNRIEQRNPDDPLLMQVLPLLKENEEVPGFEKDPLAEGAATISPGILKKYFGRILISPTSVCAINCRYCFRRSSRFDSGFSKSTVNDLAYILDSDKTISEVILSGGDPLMLDDAEIKRIISRLEMYPQIQRLRIHTRLPIVLPSRVNSQLLSTLENASLKIVVVVQSNHPAEFDVHVTKATHKLSRVGVTMMNQSVLLRNINDDAEVLIQLSECLFHARIMPYYLHLLDHVIGTAHYEVPEQRALEIMTTLRTRLPGYLVPKLVREVPGEVFKVPIETPIKHEVLEE